jgi:hypothetical protein
MALGELARLHLRVASRVLVDVRKRGLVSRLEGVDQSEHPFLGGGQERLGGGACISGVALNAAAQDRDERRRAADLCILAGVSGDSSAQRAGAQNADTEPAPSKVGK